MGRHADATSQSLRRQLQPWCAAQWQARFSATGADAALPPFDRECLPCRLATPQVLDGARTLHNKIGIKEKARAESQIARLRISWGEGLIEFGFALAGGLLAAAELHPSEIGLRS